MARGLQRAAQILALHSRSRHFGRKARQHRQAVLGASSATVNRSGIWRAALPG